MEILAKVHSKVCGLEGLTLARTVQRMGYFLPELRRKNSEKLRIVPIGDKC